MSTEPSQVTKPKTKKRTPMTTIGWLRRFMVRLCSGVAGFEVVEGFSDAAVVEQQGAGRCVIGDDGLFHEHAYGAVRDLVIDEQDIDHLVVFHVAQLYHGGGADHIEEHLLRGAAFHAGAAGDEFRSGEDFDSIVRDGGDGRSRVADDTAGEDAVMAAGLKPSEHEGSGPRGGDADDDVPGGDVL